MAEEEWRPILRFVHGDGRAWTERDVEEWAEGLCEGSPYYARMADRWKGRVRVGDFAAEDGGHVYLIDDWGEWAPVSDAYAEPARLADRDAAEVARLAVRVRRACLGRLGPGDWAEVTEALEGIEDIASGTYKGPRGGREEG